jgi:predicted PurR-regulated permease PerM
MPSPPAPPDPDPDRDLHARYRRARTAILVVTGALLCALVVVYVFRAVFLPLLLAVALAYILEPLVQWTMRRRLSRPVAVTLILAGLMLLVLGTLGWLTIETVQFVDASATPAAAARRRRP